MPVTVRPDREAEIPLPHRGRWPDLDAVRRAPVRALVARSLFERAVRDLDLRVLLPDGRLLGRGDPDSPAIRVVSTPSAFSPAPALTPTACAQQLRERRYSPLKGADALSSHSCRKVKHG